MLGKKLTALGCAAGILLFGACYGGTPDPSPPPRTAPSIVMDQFHNLRIVARNTSASQNLDSDELARAVARRFHRDRTGKAIYLEGAPQKKGEWTLKTTVLSERSSPPQRGASSVSGSAAVEVRISAMLTDKKGNMVWLQSDKKYSMLCGAPEGEETDALSVPACQAAVADMIAAQLVDDLVHSLGGGVS
jgi:hypothetical protein